MMGRAACPPQCRDGGGGGGCPAQAAPAFRAQRVTVAGRFGCLPGPGRSPLPACLPRSPPLITSSSGRAASQLGWRGGGVAVVMEDAGCLATSIPSPTRPGPIWHASSPPPTWLHAPGEVRAGGGSPWSPGGGRTGRGGSKRGFPIRRERFPRNGLHDSPITPWRHIDLLLLVLRRPPPAWCLPGQWLTQPGM